MPFEILDGVADHAGAMFVPPIARITLGTFANTTLDGKYWKNTYSGCHLITQVCNLPSLEAYKEIFQGVGIRDVELEHCLVNASFTFYQHSSAGLIRNHAVLPGDGPNLPDEGKQIFFDKNNVPYRVVETFKITADSRSIYSYAIPGIKVGDVFVEDLALDFNKLGHTTLSYDVPLAVDALEKCSLVLNAMVDQGYLTVKELNELRAQAVKKITPPTEPRHSFYEPAPMPAIREQETKSESITILKSERNDLEVVDEQRKPFNGGKNRNNFFHDGLKKDDFDYNTMLISAINRAMVEERFIGSSSSLHASMTNVLRQLLDSVRNRNFDDINNQLPQIQSHSDLTSVKDLMCLLEAYVSQNIQNINDSSGFMPSRR